MAKKNEAKVTISADSSKFDDAIKQSNGELSQLRAELKLNEAQMKTTGVTVEGLEKKHEILGNQLSAAQDKTAALSQKLEEAKASNKGNSEQVAKLEKQLIYAQIAEEKLKQSISKCETALSEQKAEAGKTQTALEKLTDEIGDQKTELDRLKDEYKNAVIEYGDTSDEAKRLEGAISDLSGELKTNKDRLENAAKKADELDRSFDAVDDGARNTEGGFTVMKGAIADLASEGIQMAIGALGDLVGYLAGLPAETLELRQDFATLGTAFDNMGFSTATATETWKDLYAVFGEDDRAVETANNIAKMADSQEDLNDWVTITTGVWGTYQDSLPVEGLAEAAMETAKTGTVTGGLADALNWSSEAATMFADYMGGDVVTAEDAFNEALAECTTEQERQQLITDTLTKLYGGAAETYRDTAGAQMEAKEATAENTLAQANLAEAIEPVTTAWTTLKTDALEAIQPVIEKISGIMLDAMEWMQEHPKLMSAIATALGIVAGALSALAIGWGVYTAAQWLANTAILGCPLTWIVGAIVAVAAVIAVLVTYWDEIVAAVSNCWNFLVETLSQWGEWIYTNVIQPIVGFFTGLWDSIVNGVTTAWNFVTTLLSTVGQWIYNTVILPVVNFFSGLWNGIKTGVTTVVNTVKSVFSTIANWVNQNVIQPVKNFFSGLWNGIKSGVTSAVNAVKNVMNTVANWVSQNVIIPVKNFFNSLWNGIKTGVTSAINAVKNVFSTISGWVNQNVIQPITGFFSKLWNGFKDGAKKAWEGVKSVFSKVGSFFGDIFGVVKDKILSVFSAGGKIFLGIKDGIIDVFKSVVNAIIKGINKVVALPFDGLNGILDTISGISILGVSPFSWLTWRCPVPQLPMLAEGGIVNRPTLNIAGEAGAEAIIPIDKLQTYIMGAVEKTMSAANIGALAEAIEEIANRPIELSINGRQFAMATASDGDSVNGLRNTFRNRGLALE